MVAARRMLGVGLWLSLATFAQPAFADRADDLYREGFALYEAGQYAQAEQVFEQALALRASHDTAMALGQTEEKLGKIAEAAQHYAHAVATLPPSLSQAQRDAVRAKYAETKTKVARYEIAVGAANAEIQVDGATRARSDAGGAAIVFLEPGTHQLAARRDGMIAARAEITALAGEDRSLALTLRPMNDTGAVKGDATGPDPLLLGLGYGLGGAAVVAAAVVGGIAAGKASDADGLFATLETQRGAEPCRSGGPPCDEIFQLRGGHDDLANAALWTGIAGGVLLAGTAIYHITMGLSDGDQPAVTMTLGPTHVGLSASW